MQFTLIYSTNEPEYTVCIVQHFCKVPSDFYKYKAVYSIPRLVYLSSTPIIVHLISGQLRFSHDWRTWQIIRVILAVDLCHICRQPSGMAPLTNNCTYNYADLTAWEVTTSTKFWTSTPVVGMLLKVNTIF